MVIVDDNPAVLASGREHLMQTVLVKKKGVSSSIFVPDEAIDDVLELEKILKNRSKINK